MTRAFLVGIWIGFWSAAGFTMFCMAEGFKIIGRMFYALAREDRE